jgi:integrase
MKLNQNTLLALTCPPGRKDRLVSDDDQAGHYVRVLANARAGSLEGKSFLSQFTFAGRRERIPHGKCSGLKLEQSRLLTQGFLGDIARGINPKAELRKAEAEARQRESEEALTLHRLVEDWSRLHLVDRRPNYSEAAVRVLRSFLSEHLDRPASDLQKETVVRLADALNGRGRKAMAAAAVAYGRAAFGWARKRGTIASNPFEGIPVAATVRRERVLSDDELAALWGATDGPGSFDRIVRALLLTGQRRDEVSGMAWEELSADRSKWTIPGARAKNGQPHVIPLPPAVVELIEASPRLGPLIFAGERGQFSGWSKSKASLDRRSGVSGWVLHDLRRTVATGMQRLGVRFEVIEHVLNHLSGSRGGLGAVYRRHDFEQEKRAALEAWAAHVLRIVDKALDDVYDQAGKD